MTDFDVGQESHPRTLGEQACQAARDVCDDFLLRNTDEHDEPALIVEDGLALMEAAVAHAGYIADDGPPADTGGLEQLFDKGTQTLPPLAQRWIMHPDATRGAADSGNSKNYLSHQCLNMLVRGPNLVRLDARGHAVGLDRKVH